VIWTDYQLLRTFEFATVVACILIMVASRVVISFILLEKGKQPWKISCYVALLRRVVSLI